MAEEQKDPEENLEKKESEDSKQDNEESSEEGQSEENKEKPKKKISKKLIIIIIPILIAIIGVGLYFSLIRKKVQEVENKDITSHGTTQKDIFADMEDLVVNLSQRDNQPSFLKIGITFQVSNPQVVEKIKDKAPLIKDSFQVYLRELRPEDMRGSAGVFRLRQDLIARVNKILAPDKVEDVLFREMLVQ